MDINNNNLLPIWPTQEGVIPQPTSNLPAQNWMLDTTAQKVTQSVHVPLSELSALNLSTSFLPKTPSAYQEITYHLEQAEQRENGKISEEDDLAFGTTWDYHQANEIPLRELTKGVTAEQVNHLVDWFNNEKSHLLTSPFAQQAPQEYPKYALKALEQGKISKEQFASVCINWSAAQDFGTDQAHYASLFNSDGSPTEEAIGYFSIQFSQDKEKLEKFFNLMRSAPSSEQIFCYLPFKDKWFDSLYKRFSDIYFKRFMPEKIQTLDGSISQRMIIPSFSMLKNYLIAQYGENAVIPWPVLGQSSAHDIELDILANRHQFGLNFPGIYKMEEADGYPTGTYGWSLHDLYHCDIASRMPKKHRWGFYHLAAILKQRFAQEKAVLPTGDMIRIKNTINDLIDLDQGNHYLLAYLKETDLKKRARNLANAFFEGVKETTEPRLKEVGFPSYYSTVLDTIKDYKWLKWSV